MRGMQELLYCWLSTQCSPESPHLGPALKEKRQLSNQPVIFKYIFLKKKKKNNRSPYSLSLMANKYVSSGLGLWFRLSYEYEYHRFLGGLIQLQILLLLLLKFLLMLFLLYLLVFPPLLRWFAKRFLHPDVVSIYDYIFLWDEDLGVEHFNPGRYASKACGTSFTFCLWYFEEVCLWNWSVYVFGVKCTGILKCEGLLSWQCWTCIQMPQFKSKDVGGIELSSFTRKISRVGVIWIMLASASRLFSTVVDLIIYMVKTTTRACLEYLFVYSLSNFS